MNDLSAANTYLIHNNLINEGPSDNMGTTIAPEVHNNVKRPKTEVMGDKGSLMHEEFLVDQDNLDRYKD